MLYDKGMEKTCTHTRTAALEYVGFNDMRCLDCGGLGIHYCAIHETITNGICQICED